jgi:hypothetical protein
MTQYATFVGTPCSTTSAAPKSNWASPGLCDKGKKTSAVVARHSRTTSPTTVIPPV